MNFVLSFVPDQTGVSMWSMDFDQAGCLQQCYDLGYLLDWGLPFMLVVAFFPLPIGSACKIGRDP